ncbi:MAG: glutamate 5-kinase [Alphaproteobacteria bacterium]
MSAAANILADANRIVIKIGSSLLTDLGTGTLKRDWLTALMADVADLMAEGREVVIVSSGAVALGRKGLGFAPTQALKLEESQAAAAAGQITLAHAFAECLGAHNITAAQILVTPQDTEERRRYLNARNTISALINAKAVPIVNENDTVATEELRYGDNDRLAARIAGMIGADLLIILSDVDGLYTANPRDDVSASHIAVIEQIDEKIAGMAGGTGSHAGSGGMKTKVEAARIANGAGAHLLIAKGLDEHALAALAKGARATLFKAAQAPDQARKRWIAGTLEPLGTITIDDGAAKALAKGNSLLSAGVTAVSGTFQRGDAVLVKTKDGIEVARGLIAYDAADAEKIAGKQSDDIAALLGFEGRTAMIHRDDMVVAENR